MTGTGEVLIETLLTEAADSVQATTGAKTLPVSKVSTKQDDVLRLAKATLGCTADDTSLNDADKSVSQDVNTLIFVCANYPYIANS